MQKQRTQDMLKLAAGALSFVVVGAIVIWRIFLLDPILGAVAAVYAMVYLYDNTHTQRV